MLSAADIIQQLDLRPHPEGGHFRETFRDDATNDGRAASTSIYYLLKAGETSHWHRVDAVEIWHWYAGAPLELKMSQDSKSISTSLLGPEIGQGHHPQLIVPRHHWQSARSLGEFTLVGCTVAPGFEFSGFEMAPGDWAPG